MQQPRKNGVSDETEGGTLGAVTPSGPLPRRLLIVSDIRILREGLAEVLARDSTFLIVGVASGLEEAIAAAAFKSPQIILIDTALPDGIRAVAQLRERVAEAQLIALALSETEDAVIAWAEAGVCGYVPRSVALGELADFIEGILRGEQVCSSRVAAGMLRRIAANPLVEMQPAARAPIAPLTAREKEIVRCLGDGISDKEIARRLNIGLATAKSHVHNVLGKLMLERRAQVARWIRTNEVSFAWDYAGAQRPVGRGASDAADVAPRSSLKRVMDCQPDEVTSSLAGKRL